jgi:hypothetical protein
MPVQSDGEVTMTNRMMSLLQRAARIRGMIESRSRGAETSVLQLLRLKRLSLLIGRRLNECFAKGASNGPVIALARVSPDGRVRRKRSV